MGTITVEQGNRLYWLGRYVERAFTSMKALEDLNDKIIDRNAACYKEYLTKFGMPDVYGSAEEFLNSFVYDKENPCSVAYSIERAYDNGIVLRDEISTEALAYLQLAMDKLESNAGSGMSLMVAMLPIEDILFGFWGCVHDYVYEEEIKDIILCGKSIERLEMYLRLNYEHERIEIEFERLCSTLRRIPKNTPYRYNTVEMSVLVEVIEGGKTEKYGEAMRALQSLFRRK